MFPSRIRLSKKTWDRLQHVQTKTRLTPNVIARISMNLALRDTRLASISATCPTQTHIINRDVLFGEHEKLYETLVHQFCTEQDLNPDKIEQIIQFLIDSGLHKLGHIQSLYEIKNLFDEFT
jgi:DNA sulfur modification protein DndE